MHVQGPQRRNGQAERVQGKYEVPRPRTLKGGAQHEVHRHDEPNPAEYRFKTHQRHFAKQDGTRHPRKLRQNDPGKRLLQDGPRQSALVQKSDERKECEAGEEHLSGQAEPEVKIGILKRDRQRSDGYHGQQQTLNVVERPKDDRGREGNRCHGIPFHGDGGSRHGREQHRGPEAKAPAYDGSLSLSSFHVLAPKITTMVATNADRAETTTTSQRTGYFFLSAGTAAFTRKVAGSTCWASTRA